MTILDKLVEATKARVARQKQILSLDELKPRVQIENNFTYPFELALKKDAMSFICEVKKASPSKGLIVKDFDYKKIAVEYEIAGADAISVLTEPDFFQGKDAYLKEIKEAVSIPVLRKDFIIDEYQIYQAKFIKADAILLIVSILTPEKLKEFIALAERLGLSALIEAHDEKEVETALWAGAKIIGVNNRNLKTFEVNLNNSVRLRKFVPKEILFVAESGISKPEDVKLLKENNVNAILVGESIIKSADKKAALAQLKG
ncbi:indole-3-glycerol phosphate synthase TrpC [Endomicrobium proavitum]|uniref:Indole-3-glycerol phosphate synthase n=1 Tax=Endomicrobium proavitum TaxID=1408281 RepID=A0A0G3WKS2_9BACT|nr:indole-3-glycerol phosphate synthase TrpC [Endomicrobium proavitum]AKL98084.1 Indole-3-glycerol phosphate synthase [Endomicrobium proavitum]